MVADDAKKAEQLERVQKACADFGLIMGSHDPSPRVVYRVGAALLVVPRTLATEYEEVIGKRWDGVLKVITDLKEAKQWSEVASTITSSSGERSRFSPPAETMRRIEEMTMINAPLVHRSDSSVGLS